ncbi:MAG: DUF615 domain-containing protein [Succinivibrionaceae bacterium]|nr:DUF615 domain-containing protein [Succinivibrionaceae bacterium]
MRHRSTMGENQHFEGFDAEPEEESRSAQKRAAQEVRRLAERICDLGAQAYSHLDLGDPQLEAAMAEARRLKPHSDSRRRQLQFAARLMREMDLGPLREQVRLLGASAATDPRTTRLERLRDQLVAGGMGAINALCAQRQGLDRQRLRALVQRAAGEASEGQRQGYRALFQYLREALGDAEIPSIGD